MRSGRRDWVIVAAWLGSLAVIRAGSVEERDPYWQIRAGLETLDGAPLDRPDSWSWAPVAHDVTWTSPLWNEVLALGYRTAGFPGFFLVALLSLVTLITVVVLLAARLGARPLPTLLALTVVLLLGLPFLSPRATVPAQALAFAAVLAADRWAARVGRAPLSLAVVAVAVAAAATTTLGMWLHLSWLGLAPLTVGACLVLWWLRPEVARARAVGLGAAALLGAGVGVLLGPYGAGALALTERVQEACAGLITEWFGMFSPQMAARWAPVGVLALAGVAVALLWVVRRWRAGETDDTTGLVSALVVFALPAVVGSFTAVRFVGIATFSLAPIAALAATHLASRAAARAVEDPPRGAYRYSRVRFWSQGRHWRPVLVGVVVLLFPGTLLLAAPLGRPFDDATVLTSLPSGCRLLSDPGTGGAAILLRPDVPVWYDGRADYWGRARNIEAARVLASQDVSGSPFTEATCIALRTDESGPARLARALDASPDWRRGVDSGLVRSWVRVG